jgi:molybdate-binding protein/DNA-binding XRE family transcriptional regulator
MLVHTRLREIRKTRGVSAVELAHRIGVSRQAIYAIEDGVFVPNTTVSLQLSRALDVPVEAIFSLSDQEATEPIRADLLPGDHVDEGQLVRVCRVNERVIAIPMSLLPAYLPSADGIIESQARLTVSIKPSAGLPEDGKRLLLAGCDPALSLLHDALHASGIEIISVPCSSRRALEWLKRGRVHAAGSHLLDRTTGDYNVPIVRRLLPNAGVRVVTFAIWEQGLVLPHGNPKRIRSIADLAGKDVTFVNREKGSGSRDLLDRDLRRMSIRSEQVRGYNSIAQGHLAAAYAVAVGTADCCIAPRSASRCFGLDFVPLVVERFDLSFTQASLELPAARALLDLLNRSHLRKKLQCIAGYDTAHTGEILM